VNRVPPHATGGSRLPEEAKVEQLEELGDDAIIAQQQSAHLPKPRVQVNEEARSVVISDHPAHAPKAASSSQKLSAVKRSSRNEKTVVIRDRRQVDELRRQMALHRATSQTSHRGVLLWVVVGVVAFVTGGLVALLATKDDGAPVGNLPTSSAAPHPSVVPPPPAPEPPKVSIDELPIEGAKKK